MTSIEIEYQDKTVSAPYKGCLYGEFGTWKTVTACGLVKNRGLLLTADTGWVSLKNHPEILAHTEVVKYKGLSQISQIAEGLSQEFDLIVVDTVSQIADEYIDFLMDNVKWSGNYREKFIPNRGTHLLPEEIPSLPDYHILRNKLRVPIKKLIKCPANVVFLAHIREPSFMEQGKGKLVRRPSMTQKVYDLLARECDFIGFMDKEAKKAEATISFKTDPRTIAKSRIGSLRDAVINAPELYKYLDEWNDNS
jgi:hypothetical protein